MDPTRFDLFTRSLSGLPDGRPEGSRRSLLQAIAGSLLASGLAPLAETVAKGKRRRRKRNGRKHRRPCLTGQKRCKGRCAGCCNDADCGGNPCKLGICADCPNGQRLCRGGCIAEDACCNDGECTGGRTCFDGACTCRSTERLCDGACVSVDYCCTSDDCDGAPCEEGRCQCLAGQRDCNGRCIPDSACCTSIDCGPCEICQNDSCVSACSADQECVSGQCRCTTNSCDGCCDGDTCRNGTSKGFCGAGGESCDACTGNEECQGGDCVCVPDCTGKNCGDDGCGGTCGSCNGGTCQGGGCVCPPGQENSGGVCATPPTCDGFLRSCSTNVQCCSGICAGFCEQSQLGEPCHVDLDCIDEESVCRGFVCTAP